MNKIYLPSAGPDDWRRMLADPEKHWETGYSAKSLAYCWEAARGFPPEVASLIGTATDAALRQAQPLLAIPEYQVDLPGGRRSSQSDLFVLANTPAGLATIMVEGKVAESFGPTIGEWLKDASPGKLERLAFLEKTLGRTFSKHPSIRYQLLHRTASALITAEQFGASFAVMIVHSFSQTHQWLDDYQAFAAEFGQSVTVGRMAKLMTTDSVSLHTGWAVGDPQFLRS